MRHPIFFAALFVGAINLSGQTPAASPAGGNIWRPADEPAMLNRAAAVAGADVGARRNIVPQVYRTLDLNRPALEGLLASAPAEFSVPMATSPEIELPLPDGSFGRFHLQESPVMEPELAAKFPEIKTYIGQGIDDPTAIVRMDLTPRGFHAMILSVRGQVFVDPYWRDSDATYVVYNKSDYLAQRGFRCLVDSGEKKSGIENESVPIARPSGATLKKYRLALGCTGEYSAAVCSPNPPSVLATLSAMITSVNRVSAVYERDFAIRLILVANNDKIVYTNANTDPYTNSDASALLGQNQTTCDGQIGSANYDIGHVFSTGGGGLARLAVICKAGTKAGGETGRSVPLGDPYDIDYVAHEMGHQFGGNHTFNSTIGSCSGNGNASTAYETGSGISIMAYAGICSSGGVITDLAPNSDDYFHSGSYTEIDNYTTTGAGFGCAVTQATGNNPPVIGALTAYTIPANTPFALTASASDPDGDTLTYAWEEFDTGASQSTTQPLSNGTNPVFRPLLPTLSPTRVFPSLSYILNNANLPPPTVNNFSTGEILPTVSRTMNFRVTVRDNHAGGGGSNWAQTTVTTSAAAGPFRITAPNSAATFAGGSQLNITWDVANSNAAPVNCANVKISLSTDGGYTFPIVLANSVPNNGAASLLIPDIANVATTQGRIKVEAVGNIFFDISDVDLTITSANPPPNLSVTGGLTIIRGTPTPAVATIGTASGASGPLSVTVAGVPYGITIAPSISGGNISLSGTADCRVTTTTAATPRTYPITLTVTDGVGSTRSASVNIIIQPNLTPSLGDYAASSASQGITIVVPPSAGPADANGNLPPAPLVVSPTAVPGGGTVSIDQNSGAVTVATTGASTIGALTIRVSLADSCGATTLKEFTVNLTAAVLAITSPPPPTVVVGTPYSHTFTYTGNPAPTFSLTSGTLPTGLTLSPVGVLSGTVTDPGTGSYPSITVTASNGVDPDVQQSFFLSVVTTSANYYSAYGLSGTAASYDADVDHDGIPNLLEYALRLDPTIANIMGLPVVQLKDYSGTKYLSISFTRYSFATDISYIAEGTSNLTTPASWSALASSVGGGPVTGAGLVSDVGPGPAFAVEVRDTVPFDPNAPTPRFLRLKITSP